MQRRNFLVNAGVLASAIVVSPSAAWSADKKNKPTMLIIQGDGSKSDMINSVIRNSSSQAIIHELQEEDISSISYSSNGFLALTNDGKEYAAEKVVFSSYKKIDVAAPSVDIKTGNKKITLQYNTTNNKRITAPEFWAFSTRKFDNGKITAFIKRNKHAFLCIS